MEKLAELFRFVLVAAGLLYIINRSFIFGFVRMFLAKLGGWFFAALLYCPSCVGFWLGLALCRLWPWGLEWYGLQSAFAVCALGSVCGVIWDDVLVQRELEVLRAHFGETEAADQDDPAPKEE